MNHSYPCLWVNSMLHMGKHQAELSPALGQVGKYIGRESDIKQTLTMQIHISIAQLTYTHRFNEKEKCRKSSTTNRSIASRSSWND